MDLHQLWPDIPHTYTISPWYNYCPTKMQMTMEIPRETLMIAPLIFPLDVTMVLVSTEGLVVMASVVEPNVVLSWLVIEPSGGSVLSLVGILLSVVDVICSVVAVTGPLFVLTWVGGWVDLYMLKHILYFTYLELEFLIKYSQNTIVTKTYQLYPQTQHAPVYVSIQLPIATSHSIMSQPTRGRHSKYLQLQLDRGLGQYHLQYTVVLV